MLLVVIVTVLLVANADPTTEPLVVSTNSTVAPLVTPATVKVNEPAFVMLSMLLDPLSLPV